MSRSLDEGAELPLHVLVDRHPWVTRLKGIDERPANPLHHAKVCRRSQRLDGLAITRQEDPQRVGSRRLLL